MPELPEVEVFKQYFDATSLHKKIKDLQVKSSEILGNISAKQLEGKLQGHKFESTRRYGKYPFVKPEDVFWLTVHFGMTGDLKYFKDIEDEPLHSRLLISFSNSFYLSYDCQRKLREVDLTETVKGFVEEKNLGPDILA